MRKILLATTALLALTAAARADVVLTESGGMNGATSNVVFDGAAPDLESVTWSSLQLNQHRHGEAHRLGWCG